MEIVRQIIYFCIGDIKKIVSLHPINSTGKMMDDFFESEGEDEFEDTEIAKLVSRYESMIKNNRSMYLSLDDYENLFMYYAQICGGFNYAEELNEEMAGLVIHAGIKQYPDSALLQMFAIYYKFLTDEYLYFETLKLLRYVEFPEYERLELSYSKCEIFLCMGAYKEAASVYMELLKYPQTKQDKIYIYSELISMLLKHECSCEKEGEADMSKIMYYLDKLISLDPKSEQKFLTEARYGSYKMNISLSLLELYAETHPFSLPGWYVLAQQYLSHSKYEKAVEAMEYAIALSDDVDLFIFMGNVYKTWGKSKEALEYYHEAISYSPSLRSFYKDVAKLYCKIGREDIGIHYYNLFLEHYPNSLEVLIDTALIFISENKYDVAMLYLEKARKIDSCAEETLSLLTKCFIGMGRNDEIIKLIERTLDSNPDCVDVWLAYSNYYVLIEDYHQALDILKQGLYVLPDDIQLLYRMANCYFLDKDNSCGINCLRLAIMMDGGLSHFYAFAEYDRQAVKLPEVVDLIQELIFNK
jgi:tetratricopeptide (TPR) repeat protein